MRTNGTSSLFYPRLQDFGQTIGNDGTVQCRSNQLAIPCLEVAPDGWIKHCSERLIKINW